LNLAAHVLARALASYYDNRSTDLLDAYWRTALRRVSRAQHFSWWMTSMLHRFHEGTEFDLKRQLAELELVASSRAAATTKLRCSAPCASPENGMPSVWSISRSVE
jgi:p-hydroxybenzoate 3-monooxygenase